MWHHPLMTKNQLTGSISLADAIAERLQRSSGSGLVEVPSADAASIVSPVLASVTGLYEHQATELILEQLRRTGYVLAKLATSD